MFSEIVYNLRFPETKILNPILDGGGGLFHPPTVFLIITLITANYMVPNSLTFPKYILFKSINKKISIFWGGTPFRPL